MVSNQAWLTMRGYILTMALHVYTKVLCQSRLCGYAYYKVLYSIKVDSTHYYCNALTMALQV